MSTMGEFVGLIMLCGVGCDLFLLPLALASFAILVGIAEPFERLRFVGHPVFLGTVLVLVAVEWAIDTFADRRTKLYRQGWASAQLTLSCMVSIVVVTTLSKGASPAQLVTTLMAAWVVTGVLKFGSIEQLKKTLSLFG
jgi:hypothetical protein